MYSRLLKPSSTQSFFLFGPRGTGKSSWVKSNMPEALYLDLLEAELYNDLLMQPQRLEGLTQKYKNHWVVIDEVQKIPGLMDEIHRLIEKYHIKFVLTGSSARKLRQKGVNLLAGRALTYAMYPLTIREMGEDFSLAKALNIGLLPGAVKNSDAAKFLESYVRTYLQEEVKQEGLTRNLSAFSRFMEAASFSQGAQLNISKVSSDCAVERKVVENYFSILEDLMLSVRLPVFTKKAKRRMAAHPKFYYFDTGVFRTLRPSGPLDSPEEIDGAALETLVLQELRALNDYLGWGYTIYYWRTSDQTEVDFVLYGRQGLHALEVKRSGKIKRDDLSGLLAFKRDYPMAKCTLIYGGKQTYVEHGIDIVPLTDFLTNLPRHL